ncbi:MAG: DUF523 domain-containing protein [Actinomycetota bacterium]
MNVPAEGRVVVSACLAGVACTHEAQPKTRDWAVSLVAEGRAILVCPEVAGGLPIPRAAAEIEPGSTGIDVVEGRARVLSEYGDEVTEQYLRGARKALDAARAAGCSLAILKARSPSCGCGAIYDGTFGGELKAGDGVTAALLKKHQVTVIDDEQVH